MVTYSRCHESRTFRPNQIWWLCASFVIVNGDMRTQSRVIQSSWWALSTNCGATGFSLYPIPSYQYATQIFSISCLTTFSIEMRLLLAPARALVIYSSIWEALMHKVLSEKYSLKGHSNDFPCPSQFTCPGEYYSASENRSGGALSENGLSQLGLRNYKSITESLNFKLDLYSAKSQQLSHDTFHIVQVKTVLFKYRTL